MKPEVLISEADKVVAYVVFEGIHNNEMHGYKPTGKKVRISLMMLLTIGAYTLMARAGLPPVQLAVAFGALVLVELGALTYWCLKQVSR